MDVRSTVMLHVKRFVIKMGERGRSRVGWRVKVSVDDSVFTQVHITASGGDALGDHIRHDFTRKPRQSKVPPALPKRQLLVIKAQQA